VLLFAAIVIWAYSALWFVGGAGSNVGPIPPFTVGAQGWSAPLFRAMRLISVFSAGAGEREGSCDRIEEITDS
jgi:hypothetical protein